MANSLSSSFQKFDDFSYSNQHPQAIHRSQQLSSPSQSENRASGNHDGSKAPSSKPIFDAHAVWRMSLNELALQMPIATYDTWMRDTWVMAYEDGEFYNLVFPTLMRGIGSKIVCVKKSNEP